MTPAEMQRAVYDILSGRAEEARDWNRFRTFYHPQARLMPVRTDDDGRVVVDMFDVERYIASRTPLLARAEFYEVERSVVETIWGRVAHVLSEYDSRRTPNGPAFTTGTNSAQFVHDGERWLITSVTWDTE